MKLVLPEYNKSAYTCPTCQFNAQVKWITVGYSHPNNTPIIYERSAVENSNLKSKLIIFSKCTNCGSHHFWEENKLVYPGFSPAPEPNEDMPEDIRADYLEAAAIAQSSPRGAAALLRLALQKLLSLYSEKRDINKAIGDLVERRIINATTQKAMDALRIVGNEAVHPAELNLSEDPQRVLGLFNLLNIICRQILTDSKEAGEAFEQLSEEKRKWVADRDR